MWLDLIAPVFLASIQSSLPFPLCQACLGWLKNEGTQSHELSRPVSDEVFDRFVFGILDLTEDVLTATKWVGLGNTKKISKLIVLEVLNEGDFDFPFKTSNSN